MILLIVFSITGSFKSLKAYEKNSIIKRKPRVIMTSDFPPIGVVKEGDVPDTQKSDPEDPTQPG